MVTDDRKRALRAVYEALDVLDLLWDGVPMDDGSDAELNHVIAGPVLAAEHHLWDARFQLKHLINEEQEEA